MNRPDSFGGQHMMLRLTSPQAASVESCDFVDAIDRLAQIDFQNAVELDRLPRRDLHRRIAQLVAEIELRQHLVGRDPAAGDPAADHHRIGFSAARFLGRQPRVTVVLLVGAVEFQQLNVAFVEVIGRVGHFRVDRSLQEIAFLFDRFQGA